MNADERQHAADVIEEPYTVTHKNVLAEHERERQRYQIERHSYGRSKCEPGRPGGLIDANGSA